MRLKAPQIKKLARAVYEGLGQKKLIKILSSQDKVLAKIEAVIQSDVNLEESIEKEARALMDKFHDKVESGEIDYQDMYSRVKKQLIKDKKFTP